MIKRLLISLAIILYFIPSMLLLFLEFIYYSIAWVLVGRVIPDTPMSIKPYYWLLKM